jgi:hypothetical protein
MVVCDNELSVLSYAAFGSWAEVSLSSSGLCQPPHVESQAIHLTRAPRGWLVLMQGCSICEYGIDDSPRSFHRVFANEQHAISMHSISQETLIGINLVRGELLDYRKMRGLGDKFFAGSLHSGT